MGKQRNSVWAQEVNYDELYSERQEVQSNLVSDAYEALNRFYQKDLKRSKSLKKCKDCWQ